MDGITSELAERLKLLADKYENKDFLNADPSQFMHRFSTIQDQEIAAFITAQLSFGRRELFIAKLNLMFEACGPSPAEWIISGTYKDFFCEGTKKFYRFYSHDDMKILCTVLAGILNEYTSLGNAVKSKFSEIQKEDNPLSLVSALISLFPECKCVSQNPKSACKRLHMFLRWMVRRNSAVDLGLWNWVSPELLLIPLDVHVMQESQKMGLLPPKCTASAKTAFILTGKMNAIFHNDPCRADYALFSLGVDTES